MLTKPLTLLACLAAFSLPAAAESLSYKEARKLLPRANAKAVVSINEAPVPQSDRAQLEGARQKLSDVLEALGDALPLYGALAISPSEGLFVDWLNGVGQHHSAEAARAAALAYCNGKRRQGSAPCVVVVDASPKGAKAGAALSLSPVANAALRGEYRKLTSPKAFAISEKTGNFGFDRGDGGRAVAACAAAGQGARDCRVVVAD